jgi:hypothetical protein
MGLKIYVPTSISIPEDLPFKRDVQDKLSFVTSKPLEEKDLINYDFKTLFYDIFFGTNNQTIYGVGPPFINLKKELPFCIYYKGQKLSYKLKDFLRSSILTISYAFDESAVELLFDFYHFKKSVMVVKEDRPFSEFAVATCQKNNPARWLSRWCEWYQKFYNMKIILYDNASQDFQDIVQAVGNYNPTMIKWDFKFGPYDTFYNLFCQIGAFNHFRLKYNFQYGFLCDIDEYLITLVDLKRYLESKPEASLFLLNNYYIPNVRSEGDQFDLEDFKYRPSKLRDRAFKYFFIRNNVRYNDMHKAEVERGETISVASNKAYFNHYKGLNTHWKPWDYRTALDPLTNDLIYDEEAQKRIAMMSEMKKDQKDKNFHSDANE